MDDSKNIPSDVVPQIVRANDYDAHIEYNENPTARNHDNQNYKMRNIVSFLTIGLCHGFGWTVMLSATYDILKGLDGVSGNQFTKLPYSNNSRECMQTSPAILLLANIVPELITKILLPFLPFYVNVNIILSCVLSIASFIIVALAQYKWQAIMGVAFMSICAAVGDITTLAYLSRFKDRKNILMAFSSGGGASGVVASLSYAALTDAGLKPKTTIYFMIIIPLVELVAFLFITESDAINLSTSDSSSTTSLIDSGDSSARRTSATETLSMTFSEKRQHLPKLMKYFIPLLISHINKCIIVQMFDLLYVPGIWLNHADQYRWMQVIRHIGSFAGHSSFPFFAMNDVWPLNLLITTLTIYFAYEAIYMAVPVIYIIFIFVFILGFICGCTSLNVFYQLTNETSPHHLVFAVCSVSTGVTLAVIVAAILDIPIHSFICKLPSPL